MEIVTNATRMVVGNSGIEGEGSMLGLGEVSDDGLGDGVFVEIGVEVGVGDGIGVIDGVGEGVGVIGCITTRIIKLKVTGVIRFNILGP